VWKNYLLESVGVAHVKENSRLNVHLVYAVLALGGNQYGILIVLFLYVQTRNDHFALLYVALIGMFLVTLPLGNLFLNLEDQFRT
jgi:hypothetical protein